MLKIQNQWFCSMDTRLGIVCPHLSRELSPPRVSTGACTGDEGMAGSVQHSEAWIKPPEEVPPLLLAVLTCFSLRLCACVHACAGSPFCTLLTTVGVWGLFLTCTFEYTLSTVSLESQDLCHGTPPHLTEKAQSHQAAVFRMCSGGQRCIPPQDSQARACPAANPFLGPNNLHGPLSLFTVQGGHHGTGGARTSCDPPLPLHLLQVSHPRASPSWHHGVRPNSALREPDSGFSCSTEIKIARGHLDLKTRQRSKKTGSS